jgi:glucokinase
MADGSSSALGVVGDIGGTNARFALVELQGGRPQVHSAGAFLCRDFPTAEQAVEAYLAKASPDRRPEFAVLAVAGPVVGGAIALTNADWRITEVGLARACGFRGVRLINDYAALAIAAPILQGDDAHLVGPEGAPRIDGPIAVLGAGTGFGVAALVRDGRHDAILTTEGGHIGFAPTDELEAEIWRILTRRFGRVSIERILSGPGLINLHEALLEIEGHGGPYSDPSALTSAAELGDEGARKTVERFCAIFGSVAGDFALSYGAQGGVFIAGGIAPRLLGHLDGGGFRSRFEAKGRFADYVRPIPTRVILHPHAALFGGARAMQAMVQAADAAELRLTLTTMSAPA